VKGPLSFRALPFCLLLGACAAPATAPGAPTGTMSRSAPPDFELRTLDGDSVRLSEQLGEHVVLLDFWATYCEPCLRSMPSLDALYSKYKSQGFLVLGVSIDAADSLPEVRAHVQKLGVSFPILLDQETRVVALYNPKTSAPYSVLIGRDGRILAKKEGYASDSHDKLEAEIQAALGALR
jgi:peroxiredoxin